MAEINVSNVPSSIEASGNPSNWSQSSTGVFTGQQYRLRAGSPMPIMRGGFVIHTFMAEVNKVYSFLCTETLPGSGEFRGQGGKYVSANFSRLNIKGGNSFQGKMIEKPTYIEEDGYGFN